MTDDEILEEEPGEQRPSGLSEPTKEAIRGGAERLVERPKKPEQPPAPQGQPPPSADLPAGKARATGGKPAPSPAGPSPVPGQAPSPGAKPKPETPEQLSPSTPKMPEGEKGPSALGKLGRGLGTAGTAAEIARHPKEGAKEAGKAVAGAAAKKGAKELSKRALQALTSETVVGPAIIEALDKLWNALKKIPGFSGFSNWAWKNKWLVIAFLVFLWMMPGAIFAASLAGLGGGLGGGWGGAIGISEQPFIPVEGKYFPLPNEPDNDFAPGTTRGFGDARENKEGRIVRHHAGVDLIAPAGSPIRAIADGTIVNHYPFKSGTHATLIDHGDFVINYGENSGLAPGLQVGDRIRAGQVIGHVGRLASGASMLHLEMYTPGTTVNQRWWWGSNRPPKNLLDPTDLISRLLGGFK